MTSNLTFQSSWAISFSILYLLVMILSISLYLSMVRAIAKTSVHNLTYHLVFLLFFAALVEFAILLEEFMSRFTFFLHLKAPGVMIFCPDSTCSYSPPRTVACSSSQCMETGCCRLPRSSPSSTSTCSPSTSRPQSVRRSGASFSPSSSFFFS